MRSAPRGSRWGDIDLRPRTALVYGSGAEHTALNEPGLGFTFVTSSVDEVRLRADQLGFTLGLPERGNVIELPRRRVVRRAAERLAALAVTPE